MGYHWYKIFINQYIVLPANQEVKIATSAWNSQVRIPELNYNIHIYIHPLILLSFQGRGGTFLPQERPVAEEVSELWAYSIQDKWVDQENGLCDTTQQSADSNSWSNLSVCFREETGRPVMKSKSMWDQGRCGVVSGCRPEGCLMEDLLWAQTGQAATNSLTSLFKEPRRKKCGLSNAANDTDPNTS